MSASTQRARRNSWLRELIAHPAAAPCTDARPQASARRLHLPLQSWSHGRRLLGAPVLLVSRRSSLVARFSLRGRRRALHKPHVYRPGCSAYSAARPRSCRLPGRSSDGIPVGNVFHGGPRISCAGGRRRVVVCSARRHDLRRCCESSRAPPVCRAETAERMAPFAP
jgi:hypothetical protein